MSNRNSSEIYNAENSSNALADFFKEKYNAAVAAELRIRNLLSQLKGECEDITLFQFFKTEQLEAIGYGTIISSGTELIQR
jgi:hypothetical protein